MFGQDNHKRIEIGSYAPDFNLKGIDGKIITLAIFLTPKFL